MTTLTIKGTTYKVKAEVELTGASAQGNYKSTLILVRPSGTKEFWAMRDLNGKVTLN